MADVMRYEERRALTFKLDELVRKKIRSAIMVITSELLPHPPLQIIELKSVKDVLDNIKREINLARVINRLKTTGSVHKGFSARSVREDRDSG